MKSVKAKILFMGVFVLSASLFNLSHASDSDAEHELKNDDLEPLVYPEDTFNGVYAGLGLTCSMLKTGIKLIDPAEAEVSSKKTNFDISAILGFGTSFYNKYYIGLELEIFRRMQNSTAKKSAKISIEHKSFFGLNLDLRLGYPIAKKSIMPYITIGVAKLNDKIHFKNTDNDAIGTVDIGSYYPTIGCGLEYKLNHQWSLKADFKYTITSSDSGKYVGLIIPGKEKNENIWKYDGKPQKMAIKIAVIYTII